MTITLLPQHPVPSHPRRRAGKAPLPAPEARARSRRAWRLTDEQVAAAFGVSTATVRSWESGRTTQTGLRRAAYAAFLSGLAQGLAPAAAGTAALPSEVHPPRRAPRRRPGRPVDRPQARPAPRPGLSAVSVTPEVDTAVPPPLRTTSGNGRSTDAPSRDQSMRHGRSARTV